MAIQFYHIIPELQPYVKMICVMDGGPAGNASFRVLPDTCAELFISCHPGMIASVDYAVTGSTYGSFANFRMRRYLDVSMNPEIRFISLCFQTGAAYRFFPVAMQEVSDSSIGISDIWGGVASDLEEQIAGEASEAGKVRLVQDFLLQQLQRNSHGGQIQHILDLVDRMKGQISVKDMARNTGNSERQLNRYFIRYVGISPKEYASMKRFIHSLKNLKDYPSDNLTGIAYKSGYYDQAHFIHEYRMFAGLTPGELLSGRRVVIC